MNNLIFPDDRTPTPLFRPGDPVVVVDAIDEHGVQFLGEPGDVVDFDPARYPYTDYNVTIRTRNDDEEREFSEVELAIDEARLFAQDHSNTA